LFEALNSNPIPHNGALSYSLLVILGFLTLQISLIVGSPRVICAQPNSTPSATSRSSIDSSAKTAKLEILKELSGSFEEITSRSGEDVVQIFARTYAPRLERRQ